MWEIVISALVALILAEFTDIAPWLARRLVRWSARIRYTDADFAETRREELEALVEERPGKLFKLGTGTRFAASAAAVYLRRRFLGNVSNELSTRDVKAPDEPSDLVARFLFPTERYRGEWRRHWFHLVKAWLFGTGYSALAIVAVSLRIKPEYKVWFVAGIVIYYLGWLTYRIASWYLTRFTLTNKRLMIMEGALARRVVMIPLIKVTDMRYQQSALARLLDYGAFTLESAERRISMRKIKDLPHPNELYLRIVEEMYEPAAVEARLGVWSEDDELVAEPDSVHAESNRRLADDLAELSGQIQRLTDAINAMNKTLEKGGKPERPEALGAAERSAHGGHSAQPWD
jgi:membrane protein YdbS with pleckstrin-like domain